MSEKLSEIFERFARDEFHNSSPIYAHLSTAIARDPELLSLASSCRKGERIPNLLFAAVHYLLLKGLSHPVARFYKSLGGLLMGVRIHILSFALSAWSTLSRFVS